MSNNKSPWGSKPGGNGPGKGNSPWGQGGNRPGGNNPRPDNAPDLDNVIQGFKKRVGGGGGGGRRSGGNNQTPFGRFGPFGAFVAVGLLMLAVSCVFVVDQNQEGVVLRFGEYSRTAPPGIHFKLPTPIESKELIDVTDERNITIGSSGRENLMLTGDENIVRIAYTVLWRVNNSSEFLFNLKEVPKAVEDVAESAMREVVGKTDLEPLITDERDAVAAQVQVLMQEMLDEYQAGVQISQVEIKESQEPKQVEAAFLAVVAAKQEAEQAILKAREKENQLIPQANADADKLIQVANGYKEAVIAESKGDAARFTSIYEEYKLAPRVTRQRMYLETMEEVYGPAEKIILDDGNSSGVVPYLPLDQLKKNNQ